MTDEVPTFKRPSNAVVAESERIHRAWLNGEDPDPDAYADVMEGPAPPAEPG